LAVEQQKGTISGNVTAYGKHMRVVRRPESLLLRIASEIKAELELLLSSSKTVTPYSKNVTIPSLPSPSSRLPTLSPRHLPSLAQDLQLLSQDQKEVSANDQQIR
jgi:hypothetical protein